MIKLLPFHVEVRRFIILQSLHLFPEGDASSKIGRRARTYIRDGVGRTMAIHLQRLTW